MTWRTLYVTGRPGFDQEVERYLNKLDIDFMTGSFSSTDTYLFWITADFNLAEFKKEIGSKTIFKYRLRFFLNMDSFKTFRDKGRKSHHFNPNQEQMFRDYFKVIKETRYQE